MGYISHIELPDGTTYDIQDNQPAVLDIPNTPAPIATFSGAANLPLSSLKVTVTPYQDLHGYDGPWVGGGGKNKLKVTATSQTIAGVTVTVKDDGTFIANGTATQNISLRLSRKSLSDTPLPEGQLILTGCPSGGSTSSYYLTCWRTNSGNANDVGNGVTFAYQSDWDFIVSLIITSGTTCNNLTFKPMIRLATETDSTFAPYSNICPIIGWDEVNVTRCGKNLFDAQDIVTKSGHTNYTYIEDGYLHYNAGNATVNGINWYGLNFPCPLTFSGSVKNFASANENVNFYATFDDGTQSLITIAHQLTPNEEKSFSVIIGVSGKKLVSLINSWSSSRQLGLNLATTQLKLGSTATEYEPYNGQTYTIDLDGTRYGGTLDVLSGVMTVDRVSLTVDENSNIISESGGLPFRIDLLAGAKASSSASALTGVKCNFLKEVTQSSSWGVDGTFSRVTTDAKIVYFKVNSEITTIQQLKTFLQSNNLQFVYELATPITVQLSPTQVKSLEGKNNISADCGQITEVKYVVSKYDGMTAKISEIADKANKLTTDAGSNLNPVYFNNGVPVASIGNSIPFVVGTGTTAGTWLGAIEGLTAYYDGLLFLYKSPVAGASTTTLNLNNLGAKTVYLNSSSKLTTHYPANQPILLAYSASTNSGCFVAIDNCSVTNAQTVNGHTVEKDVPSNAVFTDTQANWAQTTTTALDYIKNKPTFGTALTLDGTTVNHDNYGSSGTAGTSSATSGATLAVPYVTTNAQGHVTGKGTHTHTVNGLKYTTDNVSRVVMMSDGQVSVQTKGYLSCNNYANTGFKPMTASAFNVSSSRKVKENIEPIADEEAYKLLDVTPVSFDYISEIGGAKNQFGVIAEEVNDILPFVVSIPEDYKEDDDNYMNVPSVDYSKFIPHLIKLVQIQEQKIKDLQKEIFELKNK